MRYLVTKFMMEVKLCRSEEKCSKKLVMVLVSLAVTIASSCVLKTIIRPVADIAYEKQANTQNTSQKELVGFIPTTRKIIKEATMLLKIGQFIIAHWSAIVACATAAWTIYQEFRLQVLTNQTPAKTGT